MIIYKTVQKVISQVSQQKMQFLEYKTTLRTTVPLGKPASIYRQEKIKVRECIPHIGLIPTEIPKVNYSPTGKTDYYI